MRWCCRYRGGEMPAHGAIWLTYYPNIMVEWYPHVLVISTILPRGPENCTNVVEFYYPGRNRVVRAGFHRRRAKGL